VTDQAKSYKTAGAFRAALEARLQTRAREQSTDLQRLRRQVAFDRFLARMFSQGPKAAYPWVLKGGYAMELRMHSARTTKAVPVEILANAVGSTPETLRGLLEHARGAVLIAEEKWKLAPLPVALPHAPGDLCARGLKAVLSFIDNNKYHDIGRNQVHNAIAPRTNLCQCTPGICCANVHYDR
jgi:hypothetical protein